MYLYVNFAQHTMLASNVVYIYYFESPIIANLTKSYVNHQFALMYLKLLSGFCCGSNHRDSQHIIRSKSHVSMFFLLLYLTQCANMLSKFFD